MSKMNKTKPLSLRNLNYSPTMNPFMVEKGIGIATRKKRVYGQIEQATNIDTGEFYEMAQINQIEEVESEQFVKIFADGVTAAFDLSKAAYKVFLIVIKEYENHPIRRHGYIDYVELFIHQNQINGKQMSITTTTFYKGLRELISKQFLSAKTPTTYWVNPVLFFKGDRIQLIKEYRKKSKSIQRDPNTIDLLEGLTDKEIEISNHEN